MKGYVYVLHQSHEVVGGSCSSVKSIHLTRDEAILHNQKECNGYYEIQMVLLPEKELNKIQRFIKKLFKI